MNTPDYWVVVKIDTDPIIYKVFATWTGGYLDSDSWKLNSGITKVEETDVAYEFYGHSGSVYRCLKGAYKTVSYTQGVLDGILKKGKDIGVNITVLPEETDWAELVKEN